MELPAAAMELSVVGVLPAAGAVGNDEAKGGGKGDGTDEAKGGGKGDGKGGKGITGGKGDGKDGKGGKADGKGDGKGMSDAERSRIHGWGRGKGSFANGKFGGENCSCEHCLRGMAAWAALHPGRSVGP